MEADRRDFLKTAGAAALTTNIFTGNLKGANDKVNAAFIGMGRMGQGNLQVAMKQENLAVSAVCDIYPPNLEKATSMANANFPGVKSLRDFREVLADKSVDIVCIATPDHWHPYMMVEACKAGKDVYVEKPICVTVEEGRKMVEAARKYKRVVQAGTQQRSGDHFKKAAELIKAGEIGNVTFCRTWNYGNTPVEGIGNPPDGEPPAGLDWDMWLGPAPKRPFNANRFGVDPKQFSHFRWFWDYAGGMMTDWGVHLLDIVQMAFNEVMPKSVNTFGEKFRLKDNRETPDTIVASYEYPGFLATYENRYGNNNSLTLNNKSYGTTFHGDKGTLFIDRSEYQLFEEAKGAEPVIVKSGNNQNRAHWENFLACVKTREKPASDIEICQRSTTTCLLANVSLRAKMRVDWDEKNWTVKQSEARKYLSRDERKPWKLVV
ncbi:MAG TPA: Gfo/Idh/MocA family oxidoreductase [Bryobacteraceae bacterium]|nr:Gfo/Idh/MocA family oxidoreductase [Bryobacteraceae bacterium]